MTQYHRLGEGIASRDQHYEFLNTRDGIVEVGDNLSETNFWEIDEQIYDEFLEMLPPAAMNYGAFAFGEATTGKVYAVYITSYEEGDRRHFCTLQALHTNRDVDRVRLEVLAEALNAPAANLGPA